MNNTHKTSTITCLKAALIVLILVSGSSNATIINSYLGWNLCCDASVPAPLELTSITYVGGSGITTTFVPAFPAPFGVGMPDLPTFAAVPTYSTAGDGESTRTIGATMPIDWDMVTYTFPSIEITGFTVFDGSGTSGAIFPSATYTVGLIPLGVDTELSSGLGIFQGDIYDGLAGTPGNPLMTALFVSGPIASVLAQVSFAAAEASVVPVPAAAWLFVSGLAALAGLTRRTTA